MTMASEGGGEGSRSPIKIIANIFISFIGAGVLGLPYAFKEAGILEGLIIMISVGIVSAKAMLLIVDCKYILIEKDRHHRPMSSRNHSNGSAGKGSNCAVFEEQTEGLLGAGKNALDSNGLSPGVKVVQVDEPATPEAPGQDLNYGDVAYYAMGNIGRLLVEVCIIISQVGFCCAYIIFISENLSDYISGVKLVHWLFILLPPLALLTLVRHLSSLAISSLFAQVSNLMAFAVVFWFDFEHYSKIEIHPKKISVKGFPFFLAVAIYCYEGAGMILSLESSLHKDIRHMFKCYFKLILGMVTLLYISFGACGYLSFGPDTNEIITLNLPKGSSLDFAMIVKSCLCIGLFFTYPVMMFPVVQMLELKLLPNPEKPWQGNVLRFLMVGLTGLIVLAIPNFANLMALVGATCCTMLAFTLPGLFHLRLYRKYKGSSLSKGKQALDIFLIVLGVVGAVVGTWDTLMRMHAINAPMTSTALGVPDNGTADALGTTYSSVALDDTTLAPVFSKAREAGIVADIATASISSIPKSQSKSPSPSSRKADTPQRLKPYNPEGVKSAAGGKVGRNPGPKQPSDPH